MGRLMPNVVPNGLRALTIRAKDVRVGDVLVDPESGPDGTVVAVHVMSSTAYIGVVVVLEMRGALDWRLRATDLVQLRYRAC
jgi:hypothetical protein